MLVYTSSVLILLIAAMLVFVSYQADAFVRQRIQGQLQDGLGRLKTVEEERLRDLKLTANLVASLPSFVALMQGKADTATIRDVLNQYQQPTGTDLLIALNDSGQVVGRTDTLEPEPIHLVGDMGIIKTTSGTYHVAMMPAEATGRLWGYIVAGAAVGDTFARSVQNSDTEVVILGDGILGSSVPRSQLPWQTETEWNKTAGKDSVLQIRGEEYQSVTMRLSSAGQPGPLVVIMQSQTRAMQPYRGIQYGLLTLGIIAAACGIGISAFLARSITAPIAKLAEGTQQVASGNLDYRLEIHSDDEIGELAGSFNTMIQAMRERADMQKFVSMSTVEMIQSAAAKKTSAGEKVVLTILFSDMRGFTAMTEHLPPEDTVKLLNTCLSLQAGKVKKFRGDIDKYVGDCVVALFQGEDMELNAIRCAVETHRALKELNARDAGSTPIQVGIGIVTGEVVLGSIGSQDRLDYTVIGSNVNLCSRLCSQAGRGETLLGESTYERVKDLIAAQKIAPLTVKGFTQPIPAYKMDRT
jgi:class 3 adenylate cyclase